MVVKRAFQTRRKASPVLFLTVRSAALAGEPGRFAVRINERRWKVVRTGDGTARIAVGKKALRTGRNTVRVRFLPADRTTFEPSRSRLRRITVSRRR